MQLLVALPFRSIDASFGRAAPFSSAADLLKKLQG
jgi:hypothetical protein